MVREGGAVNDWVLEYLGLEIREAVAWALAGFFLGLLGWRERAAAAEAPGDEELVAYELNGFRFFGPREGRDLVLIGEGQPYAGWLTFQNDAGDWVLLREPTAVDFEDISRAQRKASGK